MKALLPAVALATVILAATTLDAAETVTHVVEKFEWTAEGTCVAVSNGGTLREVIDGVHEDGCSKVLPLTNVIIHYTHADNGTGYLATVEGQDLFPQTCWNTAEGIEVVCDYK